MKEKVRTRKRNRRYEVEKSTHTPYGALIAPLYSHKKGKFRRNLSRLGLADGLHFQPHWN